jgi:hypothetical protein
LYLPPAPLVASKDFEKAIVKLQNNIESTLVTLWLNSLLEQRIPKELDCKLQQTQSMYHPVHHILPTSNVVERLFSRANLFKNDHRKTMTAAHLDAMLFLRRNRER